MPYTVTNAVLTGWQGSPGYTKFKFSGALTTTEAGSAIDKARAFFTGIAAYMPSVVKIDLQQSCDIFDDQGQKTGVVSGPTVPVQVAGVSVSAFSAASGAYINWQTNVFANGSRVTGRTFVVPLALNAYTTQGVITATALTALQGAANTLMTGSPTLIIRYFRVKDGVELFGIPPVVANTVPSRVGVLRSRKV